MYQKELADSGHALFRIRGAYLYTIIAIGVLIAWVTRARGPFLDEGANTAWFWVSLAVALAASLREYFAR